MTDETDTSRDAVLAHLDINQNHEAGLIPAATEAMLRALLARAEAAEAKLAKARGDAHEFAWDIAVKMEVHAAVRSKTKDKAEEIEKAVLALLDADAPARPAPVCDQCGTTDPETQAECPLDGCGTARPAPDPDDPFYRAYALGVHDQQASAEPLDPRKTFPLSGADQPAPRDGVTVEEEAARVLLANIPNPIFDDLKPLMTGEFHLDFTEVDEDGNEIHCAREIPWTEIKAIIRAALRALTGENGDG